jgi:hypothetical protein
MKEIMRSAVMTFWSDGGQRTARRNAWSAMVADAKRASERAEATAFMNAVAAVHPMSAPASDLSVATVLAQG